jgi:UDP-N-acetylglucosamine 2-epimerase (non-hydrolysing)
LTPRKNFACPSRSRWLNFAPPSTKSSATDAAFFSRRQKLLATVAPVLFLKSKPMKKLPVVVIVGTRPEAVKMAPVIRALKKSKTLTPITLSTSQHKQMTRQILAGFDLKVDHDLNVMRKGQNLWDLSSRLVTKVGRFLDTHKVAAVLVQGDTTSAFFGGLCAFYHKVPVGHIEAGLRTHEMYSPFPEEMNRTLLGALATWHFPPTDDAVARLRAEDISADTIHMTGNTVVDALRWMVPRCSDAPLKKLIGADAMKKRLILVTCHRRENLGAPMKEVATSIATIARENPDTVVLFPVHPNPAVRATVTPLLSGIANVVLTEPLDYDQFLSCLKHAYLVLSDSGGVQEEATALGKPVLVLRESTERQEGVKAGALKLVGTNGKLILRETRRLLNDRAAYEKMSRCSNVFGDGKSSERIVKILERSLAK